MLEGVLKLKMEEKPSFDFILENIEGADSLVSFLKPLFEKRFLLVRSILAEVPKSDSLLAEGKDPKLLKSPTPFPELLKRLLNRGLSLLSSSFLSPSDLALTSFSSFSTFFSVSFST